MFLKTVIKQPPAACGCHVVIGEVLVYTVHISLILTCAVTYFAIRLQELSDKLCL